MALNINIKDNSFTLDFLDFSGGLNTRDLDTVIKDNELSGVANFNFNKRGALKFRMGFTKFGNTALGSFAVKSVGGYYKVGEDAEIIATGSTIISKVTSTSKTDIKTGLTGDGLVFDMHQYMNHYYMANGTDAVQVYDGSAVWDIGYPIPTSNCTATDSGSAGVLEAKAYKYKVTYYYNDGESNSCSAETGVTPTANHSVNLTAIPVSASARVAQRKIYRTIGGGATYKLLTTINDNSSTTYTDNIPDSGLGADMDTDNNIPPVCKYVVNHKGRLWLAGDPAHPSRVYYSKALHPESFPALYYWDVGDDDGTIITGLTINLSILVIFKNYSTWLISGDTPLGNNPDMALSNANPRVGCISAKTMAHAGNDLLFLSPNLGVQRLHRVILATTETMDVDALSDKIDATVKGLNSKYLQYAHAEVFDHKYHLFVPDGVSQTTNNLVLALDLRNLNPADESTIRWTRYTNMNFASCALIYDTNGDRLLVGSNTTGYIYDFGVGTNDDGAPIKAYATTKNHDIGSFMNDKTLRSMVIYGRASEDWKFAIRLFTNNRGEVSQHVYEFTAGTFYNGTDVLWDSVLFDKFMWDSNPGYTNTIVDFMKPKLLTQSSVNLLKLKIESVEANQEFALYGVAISGVIGNKYLFD